MHTKHNGYFLPTIEIKDYNIMIEAFANDSSANLKFLETQLSKMIQFERLNFLDLINPAGAVINNINKIQNLARKVSDDKIDIAADLVKAF